MRLPMKHCLAGLAALTLTMPVWAARTYKEPLSVVDNTTIGSARLKPGSYELAANDTKKDLNILQNGKVVATVQGQWFKLAQKPPYSMVISNGDKITQVEFSGTEEAFKVQ
jgi:hypothetical protein